MKRFFFYFATFFLLTSTIVANPQQALHECNILLMEEEWDDLDLKLGNARAEIEKLAPNFQTPYWKTYNRFVLKELLATQSLRIAYQFIFSGAQQFYEGLDYYTGNHLHSPDARAALFTCLTQPSSNLRPYATRHANEIHELIYSYALALFYNDALSEAYTLCNTLLNLTDNNPRSRLRCVAQETHIKTLLLKTYILLHVNKVDKAESTLNQINKNDALALNLAGKVDLAHAKIQLYKGRHNYVNSYCALARTQVKKHSTDYAGFLALEADSLASDPARTQKRITLYSAAEATYHSKKAHYERGITLAKLYEIRQNQQEDEEACEYLERNAFDLAQKKTLPLLMRILNKRSYSPQESEDLSQIAFETYTDADITPELTYQSYPLEVDEPQYIKCHLDEGMAKKPSARMPRPYPEKLQNSLANQQAQLTKALQEATPPKKAPGSPTLDWTSTEKRSTSSEDATECTSSRNNAEKEEELSRSLIVCSGTTSQEKASGKKRKGTPRESQIIVISDKAPHAPKKRKRKATAPKQAQVQDTQ